MRTAPGIATLAAAVCALSTISMGQQPTRAPADAKSARATGNATSSPDEIAIRKAAIAFSQAYNAHDPKAIADLFAPEGELVDPDGNAQRGRVAIEGVFAALFEEFPEATMSIEIESIRFPRPILAIEDGVATVVLKPGGTPEPNRYTAVHLKHQGNKWLLASVRDLQDNAKTASEELQQLAWLIGDWVDESPDALNVTSYQWADNHGYILGQFTIQIAGHPVMTGTQRIGWDPLDKVIRNWVFDSEGGFATGAFSREDNHWIIKQTAATRDGQPASATNTITQLGPDRFSWESRDRTIGGLPTPDVEPVTVVRKPPKPGN